MTWRQYCLSALALLALVSVVLSSPVTQPRFTASYTKSTVVTINQQLEASKVERLLSKVPELEGLRRKLLAGSPSSSYTESATGAAEIDTLNSVFRFNITSIEFSYDGKSVQNSKPRATTLLMYDLILGSYNTSLMYRAGTNFTWATQSCICSGISTVSSGGSPIMFTVHPNSWSQGPQQITINKKTITSDVYNFTDRSFIPTADSSAPLEIVEMDYQFFVTGNKLNRVRFRFFISPGVESITEYDFWTHNEMTYSSAIVPDNSCSKSCIATTELSIRSQTTRYPSTCEEVLGAGCVCLNHTEERFKMCNIPWSVSSEINIEFAESYAMQMKNWTAGDSAIPKECRDQLEDFMCKFYFPPCDLYNARMRPPINDTLRCFRENPLYYTPAGFISANEAVTQSLHDSFISYEDSEEPSVPVFQIPVDLNPPLASQPFPAVVPASPSPEPLDSPVHSVPEAHPTQQPPTHIPETEPASEPSHSAPVESPAILVPSVPLAPGWNDSAVMTNSSIAYATSFAVFSAYDVVAKHTYPYPDLYTLKNWQIALMLIGSVALLLTIVISIIMANRRVVNHYEKV